MSGAAGAKRLAQDRTFVRTCGRTNVVGRPRLVKRVDVWGLELRLDCVVHAGVRLAFCPGGRRRAVGERSYVRANVRMSLGDHAW